jgi:CheY-like chemotaxis protein
VSNTVFRQKQILLVDDNPNDAELTIIGFKRNQIHHSVMYLDSGVNALQYLFDEEQSESLPYAVVLDLKMPKVTGLEVLREIRNHPRTIDLPVIILTSSAEESDITACDLLGVNAYLQKPVSFQEFSKVVKKISDILSMLENQILSAH